MPRKVILLPHDPNWTNQYLEEAERLADVLSSEMIAIHHMGSTAIPAIYAKPIIDILVVVKDINRIDPYNNQMALIGYTPRGEHGIPGRRYFSKDKAGVHTHHVHIFQAGNSEIDRHLGFRDYLRLHPDDALAYSQLKEDLANIFADNVDQYTEAKSDFIRCIEEKSKLPG
jgi:GrpB-like predicted nucleotidyltransferase (UPF0157 family)